MPDIPGLKADVFFGDAQADQLPDWRKLIPDRDDEDDEDEPLSTAERAALVGILGFDPTELETDSVEMSQWVESEHPRGQPENAGEFGSKGGTKKTSESSNSKIPDYVGKPIRSEYEVPDWLKNQSDETMNHELTRDQVDALRDYTHNGYKELNASMRQCPPNFTCLEEFDREQVELIDTAIEQAGRFEDPVVVYRGMTGASEVLSAMQSCIGGDPIMLPSITSTSVNPEKAYEFTVQSSDNCLFHITAKTGLYVESLSSTPGEEEVLKSSGTKYKVVAVQKAQVADDKIPVVYLEEV